ncbi:MAG: AAA family ATPase [Candidatus Hodarchaeota archaeon]
MSNPFDNLKTAFEAGKQAKDRAVAPYELLGFFEDPFAPDFLTKHPESLYINEKWKEQHTEGLIYRIGASLPSLDTTSVINHLLVVGSTGSGKSILARNLVHTLSERELGLTVTPTQWIDINSRTSAIAYEKWLSQVNTKFNDSDKDSLVVFIDDVVKTVKKDPQVGTKDANTLLKDLQQVTPNVLLVGFVSISERFFLQNQQYNINIRELMEIFQQEITLPLLTPLQISHLLQKRLEVCQRNASIRPFTKNALNKIGEYSLGLPDLALRLAHICFKHATELVNEPRIDNELVETKAVVNGYHKALEIFKAESDDSKITKKRKQLLLQLLYRYSEQRSANQLETWGLTNTNLQERLGMQASSISYHLQDLWSEDIREAILRRRETEKDNRSKLYYLEPPVLNALENRFWGLRLCTNHLK